MFNLGYLPGGSHAVFTTPQHSLPALDAAWRAPFLPGGALTVCVFRRHAGHGRARRGAGLGGCPARQGCKVAVHLFRHEAGQPPIAVCLLKEMRPAP